MSTEFPSSNLARCVPTLTKVGEAATSFLGGLESQLTAAFTRGCIVVTITGSFANVCNKMDYPGTF